MTSVHPLTFCDELLPLAIRPMLHRDILSYPLPPSPNVPFPEHHSWKQGVLALLFHRPHASPHDALVEYRVSAVRQRVR